MRNLAVAYLLGVVSVVIPTIVFKVSLDWIERRDKRRIDRILGGFDRRV